MSTTAVPGYVAACPRCRPLWLRNLGRYDKANSAGPAVLIVFLGLVWAALALNHIAVQSRWAVALAVLGGAAAVLAAARFARGLVRMHRARAAARQALAATPDGALASIPHTHDAAALVARGADCDGCLADLLGVPERAPHTCDDVLAKNSAARRRAHRQEAENSSGRRAHRREHVARHHAARATPRTDATVARYISEPGEFLVRDQDGRKLTWLQAAGSRRMVHPARRQDAFYGYRDPLRALHAHGGHVPWPTRLWLVEGTAGGYDGVDDRVRLTGLTVAREIDIAGVLGPNGPQVVAMLDRLANSSPGPLRRGDLPAGYDEAAAAAWRTADAAGLKDLFSWVFFTAEATVRKSAGASRWKGRGWSDPWAYLIAATVIRDHLPGTYDVLSAAVPDVTA